MKKNILWMLLMLPVISFAQIEEIRTKEVQAIPAITLNCGIEMPVLGFGTSPLNGTEAENSVAEAISVGYRLIDTAKIYGNEEAVGKGIRKSGIDRKELFITTKLWVDDMGYEATQKGFEESLRKLGVDYIDLYLIHRPRPHEDIKGSWQAMEELCRAGKIRAIGVSNFNTEQLDELLSYATIKPAINQIETSVFFQQVDAQTDLGRMGIQMEAWSPLAAGRNGIFQNPILADIGKKYNKSNAQIALRWLMQRGLIAVSRTTSRMHMLENVKIFDFELSNDDMAQIATLDMDTTQFPEWD